MYNEIETKTYRVTLGDYDWLVLKKIGTKTLLLSESVLFRGYYALEPCSLAESKAGKFLQTVFAARLKDSGINTEKISNISFLTLAQYDVYVKPNFKPSNIPYALANINPSDPEQICQIDKEGNAEYIGIREQTGFRPCIYIDTEYLKAVLECEEIQDVASRAHEVPVKTDDTPSESKENKTEHQSGPNTDSSAEENKETEVDTTEHSEEKPHVTEAEDDTAKEAEKKVIAPQDDSITEGNRISSDNVSIEKEEDGTYSVRMYGGEFKPFAMVYDGSDEKIRSFMEKQGISISDFFRNSRNDNRTPMDTDSMLEKIKKNQDRWSWKNK